MPMIFIGIFLIVIGIALYFGQQSQQKKVDAIQSTETSTIKHLQDLAESMSDGVGEGSLSYYAEIKGTVECDAPLKSEISNTDCVYYDMMVTRDYEEIVMEKDADGREHRKTKKGSDTVASNTRSISFYVKDRTGRILVKPSGAEFVADKVYVNFEPAESQKQNELRFGNFTFTVPETREEGDRKTLGYELKEYAIPVGSEIYVLGEASDKEGELCIKFPGDRKKFLVSMKGEDELISSSQSSARGYLIGAVICGVIGIGLVIAGLLV